MRSKQAFQPGWCEIPPGKNTYRSIFKWGASDKFRHPTHNLYTLLKDRLGMTDADFKERLHTGDQTVKLDRPPALNHAHIEALREMVGDENASTSDYDRVKYSFGKSAYEAFQLREGNVGQVTDLVLHPRHRQDVINIVAYCHRHTIPMVPYGGGSSVTLGLRPTRPGVVVVLQTHMHRILSFNEENQTITVESGILGPDYEHALNHAPEMFGAKYAYTAGHFPQSFEHSTVGGWIATFGSGQQSSYYGDVGDLVMSQDMVTPTGAIQTLAYPATATGPSINEMLKGTEGTFGVTVSATLKIFKHLPQNRKRFSFMFPNWRNTVQAARSIYQGEFGRPSVFRISDPEETDIAMKLYGIEASSLDKFMSFRGYVSGQRCLLIGQADGDQSYTKTIKRNVMKHCRRYKGMYLSGLPVKKWERHRFADPYLREDLNDFGVVIDTLETAIPWDGLHNLYEAVRVTLRIHPQTAIMTHASHFYPQGTNLYFIFITHRRNIKNYLQFLHQIIACIHAHGGSLSHHHGVGRLMAPWMETHLGKKSLDLLRAIKTHLDPHAIMNPGGTLGLEPTGTDRFP